MGKKLPIPSIHWNESMFIYVTSIADLAEALKGPMFESLKEPEVFRKLRVDEELQTIVWPNGTDLAPEYIYFQAFRNDSRLQATFREWGYVP